jgi:putative heme-binding domain-containing protein
MILMRSLLIPRLFCLASLALFVALGGRQSIQADDDDSGRWRTQKPAVMESVEVEASEAGVSVPESDSVARDAFFVPPGFQVELIYTVPREEQGSWVALGVDPQGRLIASDQGDKGLYRITPAPIGSDEETKVESLPVPVTAAQGLLYAFDSLYISVNGGPGSGLYRARDTNGDDQYDELVKLKDFQGGGEHGPHALRLSPDGESIYVVAGNHTRPPADFDHSRVPSNWDEDLLLPRQWDARGHARGILAPGGWIAKTDPDGKTWEVTSIGYRNVYSIDFNADGELFAYDADMEWDMGMPWYRPTRVNHATSGSEFGWRSGTGKWPSYFVDSLPELVDIGPGSPVGIHFGYGTAFPAKYQRALYLLDWTFGTIYALHLEPDGASYRATKEEFLSRTPLPLTDIVIGADGALYFAVGGRGTQSELYRVTYVGDEATDKADLHDEAYSDQRQLRREIEQHHTAAENPSEAVEFVWPHLSHEDRYIRYAARVALEHQDLAAWQDRVLAAQDPQTLIEGAVALARQGEAGVQEPLLDALARIDLPQLDERQQLDLLRAYQLVFIRLGEPDETLAGEVAKRLDPHFPSPYERVNQELSQLLVYLQSPTAVAKTIELMKQPAPQQVEEMSALLARNRSYGGTIAQMLQNLPDIRNIQYLFVLRNAREGWTLDHRRVYWEVLQEARGKSGGASYQGFLDNIEQEAFDNASDNARLAIEALGIRQPYTPPELPEPQGPGREWTLEDLLALEGELQNRNFENGKNAFAAARCVVCHRFGGEGGATGPDLTQAAGRFNWRDLSESIIDPSRVISDQYRASVVITEEGQVHTGQVVSETDDALIIVVDPEDASKVVEVPKASIEELQPSPVSLMPKDLINPLNQDEVLDLMAYLLSRGNPRDPVFRRGRGRGR